ncbi:MAG: four helix bundle protein [Pyrinomonadaceae bacterium]|nr:four helix bundle protein [Pyrinomonadaceae bacterium]
MRPHERLNVWKKSIDLSVSIYNVTECFPKREWYGLAQQLRRASVSVSSNIAEGSARSSKKEFLHFLAIAQGSASEIATQILIAKRLGYVSSEEYRSFYADSDEIGRMISGLRKTIISSNE